MAGRNPKAQGEEVELKGAMTIDEALSKTKLIFDLATTIRALHKDPS